MADNLIQNLLVNNVPATTSLKNALDAQAARQRAHTQNIANAETPGYQRVRVEFEDLLSDAINGSNSKLARSDDRHLSSDIANEIAGVQHRVEREPIDPASDNLNGVDIDQEMAEMAETQLRYLASVELLRRRYTDMKSAIRGGG
ncbi:flagellar basal body rod protein FlgB [bacterium]|nr:flagellar basal body rod protein FlgB [bacterium]MBU1636742.1 flagellar basal body rod protein FlgB [bacterium]MBU1920125.1 flagellar basal body rod protein FlgB [bacterium]